MFLGSSLGPYLLTFWLRAHQVGTGRQTQVMPLEHGSGTLTSRCNYARATGGGFARERTVLQNISPCLGLIYDALVLDSGDRGNHRPGETIKLHRARCAIRHRCKT